jgi:hypothetical protein
MEVAQHLRFTIGRPRRLRHGNEWRRRAADRRERDALRIDHDRAMTDARVLTEHLAAIDRARLHGEPGCCFCR